MPYDGEPVRYQYQIIPLPNHFTGATILCIKPVEEDMELIEFDHQLWGNLVVKAVEKNGKGKTLGVLMTGTNIFVPVPDPRYDAFIQFLKGRPTIDQHEWPYDRVEHIY